LSVSPPHQDGQNGQSQSVSPHRGTLTDSSVVNPDIK